MELLSYHSIIRINSLGLAYAEVVKMILQTPLNKSWDLKSFMDESSTYDTAAISLNPHIQA